MYATELTRDYLEKIGVTKVSEDGLHIYEGEKELPQLDHADGYKRVLLYDKELYAIEYPLTKNRSAGTVIVGVHRLVYAWFNGKATAGMVVDHKDNNKSNNAISNLQLLTPGENSWKDREHGVKQIKCKLNKPRSFYAGRLAKYELEYEQAKADHDEGRCHKLRSNISQMKARLRYWDAHADSAKAIMNAIKAEQNIKAIKKEIAKKKKDLCETAALARALFKMDPTEDNYNLWKKAVKNRDTFNKAVKTGCIYKMLIEEAKGE